MRFILLNLFGLLFISCWDSGQDTSENDLNKFNDFIGNERARVLNAAVVSFEQFLFTNFQDIDNHTARTKVFLEHIKNNSGPDSSWILATEKNKEIINDFENSGLRREIWIYGYEDYDPKYDIHDLFAQDKNDTSYENLDELDLDSLEPDLLPTKAVDSTEMALREKELEEKIKNSIEFNVHGQYLYAIMRFGQGDTAIQEYGEAMLAASNISPAIIASGLLSREIDFDNPFVKRILVTEFYYWIMKWDLQRGKNH